MTTRVLSPVAGATVALADVPDPVFAGSIVGPGIAVDPERAGPSDVLAPISGTVATLHPHALVIVGEDGHGVLVHLGLDTVQLQGEGFTRHVAEKDVVTAGQPLISWDPGQVEAGGRSPVSPVVALEAGEGALTFAVDAGTRVAAGDELFVWQ